MAGGAFIGHTLAKELLDVGKNYINSYEKSHRFNTAPNKDDLIDIGR
jgi:hypothetical protein